MKRTGQDPAQTPECPPEPSLLHLVARSVKDDGLPMLVLLAWCVSWVLVVYASTGGGGGQ